MEICRHDICTGCGACVTGCAQCAITLRPDGSGHIYPHIDADVCVECGACVSMCDTVHAVSLHEPSAAYAVCASAPAERAASSSGGAAVLLARAAISEGAVVYACVQDDYRNIYHCRLTEAAELERMRGSKYVQSDLRTTYAECRNDLEHGRRVLYIGTPCQIAGLRATLPGDVDGLCTVDIVCHGVPSQLMLREDISMIRAKTPISEGATAYFRRKDGGKVRFGMYIHDGNKEVYARNYPNDYFIAGFLKGIFFRPNCFDCRYATASRVGDITVGDFWGLGKEQPTAIDSAKGVSLLMVNTDAGGRLAAKIADGAVMEQRPLSEAINGNAQLRHSFVKPGDYDEFNQHYRQHGYESACRRYLDAYIKRNRRVMFNEDHPWLSLPLRIVGKLLNR